MKKSADNDTRSTLNTAYIFTAKDAFNNFKFCSTLMNPFQTA
jgi:hypothetical protein